MKNRFTFIFIAALLALTVLAAGWHLSTRTHSADGALTITQGACQLVMHADAFDFTDVQGKIVNGKGESTDIHAKGISVSALPGADTANAATAIASDEYSARISREEFDRTFITLQPDGSFQLVVFGDPDSRRCVRNLTEVILE